MSGECEICGEHCLDCKCGIQLLGCDPPGTKFELVKFQLPEFLSIPDLDSVKPQKCLTIHSLDGYETYKIDDNTIGVRPIWYSVKDKKPLHQQDVLFLYSDKTGREFLTGWYDKENREWVCNIVGFFRDVSEKAYQDSIFKNKNVTHWMPLPQSPKE